MIKLLKKKKERPIIVQYRTLYLNFNHLGKVICTIIYTALLYYIIYRPKIKSTEATVNKKKIYI